MMAGIVVVRMKTIFDLRKVIDPHKHMPNEIKNSFLKLCYSMEYNNNSFYEWKVGSFDKPIDSIDEDDIDVFGYQVDTWMLQHFKKNEKIIILHWW